MRGMLLLPFRLLVPDNGKALGVLRFDIGDLPPDDAHVVYLLWLGDRLLPAKRIQLQQCQNVHSVYYEGLTRQQNHHVLAAGPAWAVADGAFTGPMAWYFDTTSDACRNWLIKQNCLVAKDALGGALLKLAENESGAGIDGIMRRFANVYDSLYPPTQPPH